jgi:nucleoside-diphosphate-sugar epimerase
MPVAAAHPVHPMILITGATGFLGGATVCELIGTSDWQQVLLLVRATDAISAVARVRTNLERFAIPESVQDLVDPAQVICGDLTQLDSLRNDPRLERITHVLNCAAVTSFGSDPRIWTTNVDATVCFARLMAGLPRLERFIQVGTAMICGSAPARLVYEDDFPRAGVDHLVPYTESKDRAESLLHAEINDERLVVVRPSIIVGHTRLGVRPSHSIFWAFRMSHAMRRTTCAIDGVIDVVPVDWVARSVLTLLRKPRLRHRVYHLSAGETAVSFLEIGKAFDLAEGTIPSMPYAEVTFGELADLQERYGEFFGPCNRRFMLRAIKLYGAFAGLNTRFVNSRILEEGVPMPDRFTDYLALCLRTCQQHSIAEQMLTDFQ